MVSKLSNQSDDLRAMLAQALQAYELTRIAHLQTTALAKAEQERISHLLTFTEQVRQASRDLLEKASLAYIAGAPLQLNKSASPVRSNDKAVAAAFSEAQLAYIDLRTALFQLAAAFLDSKRWEQARRAAQPLLEDTQAPLFRDARNLLYESHYQAALEKNDIAEMIGELHQLALLNIRYKKTIQMLEEIFIREELFTRLSNADAWDLVAQIFLILQATQGTNLLMRQRLDSTPELQAAMKAITEIELLWTTNTSVLWTDQYHSIYEHGLRIVAVTFSESANLIALAYQAEGYEGQYHTSGSSGNELALRIAAPEPPRRRKRARSRRRRRFPFQTKEVGF